MRMVVAEKGNPMIGERGRLFTFLGTGRYERVRYVFNGRSFTSDAVVEALAHIADGAGERYAEIVVFATLEAQSTNWTAELEARLRAVADSVELVTIPQGRSESELWQIFDVMTGKLAGADSTDCDITHGFRSLPLLALIVAQYGAALYGCCMRRILYGAYEAGPPAAGTADAPGPQAREGEPAGASRTVPVFDLSPFANLIDWTLAVDRFLTSSDASTLCALTQQEIKPVLAMTRGEDQTAAALRRFATALEEYTASVRTCRGPELKRWERDVRVRLAEVESLTETHVRALTPVLSKLRDKLPAPPADDDARAALNAAEWCLRHDLIQQGLTILEEAATTFACILLGLDPQGYGAQPDRRRGNEAIVIVMKRLEASPGKWGEVSRTDPERTRSLTRRLRKDCAELIEVVRSIKQARNDINHSGFSDSPRSPGKLQQSLERSLAALRKIVDESPHATGERAETGDPGS